MMDGVDTADDPWILAPGDHALVMSKRGRTRLGFAILLAFFRDRGRFPRHESEVDPQGIATLSQQLNVRAPVDGEALLVGRTAERMRSEIRVRFGFREATVADADALSEWLRDHAAAEAGGEIEAMVERLEARCRELAIEPPTAERVERIARAALRAHEERFHADIYGRLSPAMRERLDELLGSAEGEGDRSEAEDVPGSAPAALLKLRGNPGRPSLASMQEELAKLDLIRRMDLPADLFDHASPRDLERCRRRVAVEAPHELRRHPDAARIAWLAAFVYLRARSLIDDLVDLLIETIHQIGARAERKVERELLDDLKRVTGKQNLLFELADATLAQPDGVVRDVVFPVVGEQTLRDLVKEWKATGPTYRTTLRTVIRNSYQGHYRRMVPKLLVALEFRSNNERHRPVMQALELVKRFADTKVRTFPADEEVPLDGVVRGLWRDAVVEKDSAGRDRINRVTYEVAVLETLREQLRCKEIWVVGANRYRNPDEDLPADFEANRDEYYKALNLPLDADRFITELQDEMREALNTLDGGLKKNPHVRHRPQGRWLDHADATGRAARSTQPDGVQGRTQCDLADDQSARHGQGNRSSAGLHRRAEKSDRLRNAGALGAAAAPAALPARDRDQCRAATHGGPGVRRDGQGFVLCAAPLYQRRHAPPGDRDRCRRHAEGPKSCHLGFWHNGLCLRFQTLRRLGPESHHAMARALWRAWHHDLLAC